MSFGDSTIAKISEQTISDVRALGVLKIVEQYVDLSNKGGSKDLWGICPFHNEKSPSFHINAEDKFYKCFGCDAKGDGITFVMKRLGFSYADAIIFIAEKFGIDITYDGKDNKSTKDILSLHLELQKMMRDYLYSPIGKDAKDYILARSFTDSELDEFGIGFIPSYADFKDIFHNFDREILLSSGFFKLSKDEQHINSRFFNRLTIPIRNITGSIAGFAGRSIDDSMPKYLNSADSDIFHKGEVLFNIDKARSVMKQGADAIIVEGYFDVMRLAVAGYKSAVAPMGTALTENQIALIKRYTDNVTVIFDGDEAGDKASRRSLPLFVKAGVSPKVVFLPKDEDPDSLILKQGKDIFAKLYDKRDDLFLVLARRAANNTKDDINKKLTRFKSIRKLLLTINDPHLRDHYIEKIADIFGLKIDNINEDLEQLERINSNIQHKKFGIRNNVSIDTYTCEKDFLTALFTQDIDIVDGLMSDLSDEMFKDDMCREIFKIIAKNIADITDIRDIQAFLGDEYFDIILRPVSKDSYKMAVLNKDTIINNALISKKNELIAMIKSDKNKDTVIQNMKELSEITIRLANKKS